MIGVTGVDAQPENQQRPLLLAHGSTGELAADLLQIGRVG
jgi:hypothetical protein